MAESSTHGKAHESSTYGNLRVVHTLECVKWKWCVFIGPRGGLCSSGTNNDVVGLKQLNSFFFILRWILDFVLVWYMLQQPPYNKGWAKWSHEVGWGQVLQVTIQNIVNLLVLRVRGLTEDPSDLDEIRQSLQMKSSRIDWFSFAFCCM